MNETIRTPFGAGLVAWLGFIAFLLAIIGGMLALAYLPEVVGDAIASISMFIVMPSATMLIVLGYGSCLPEAKILVGKLETKIIHKSYG